MYWVWVAVSLLKPSAMPWTDRQRLFKLQQINYKNSNRTNNWYYSAKIVIVIMVFKLLYYYGIQYSIIQLLWCSKLYCGIQSTLGDRIEQINPNPIHRLIQIIFIFYWIINYDRHFLQSRVCSRLALPKLTSLVYICYKQKIRARFRFDCYRRSIISRIHCSGTDSFLRIS